ncbi:hypothetical protein GGS23DRAFT_572351 [Durotheca rogersii]|uniref:uncharacterized protein n=1 Tax=Durotheca rogersii TaxID=419775 RepID=UPI00221F930D|nr:uncharacterized protein GGS23DRAFT_572351 [Durotheca rogersii]KAI5862433.1 hypothetical protein GGS23DRAFT_572351 [Durotheca rogersii]
MYVYTVDFYIYVRETNPRLYLHLNVEHVYWLSDVLPQGTKFSPSSLYFPCSETDPLKAEDKFKDRNPEQPRVRDATASSSFIVIPYSRGSQSASIHTSATPPRGIVQAPATRPCSEPSRPRPCPRRHRPPLRRQYVETLARVAAAVQLVWLLLQPPPNNLPTSENTTTVPTHACRTLSRLSATSWRRRRGSADVGGAAAGSSFTWHLRMFSRPGTYDGLLRVTRMYVLRVFMY